MHPPFVAALLPLFLLIGGCSRSPEQTQFQFADHFIAKLKGAAPGLSIENIGDLQLKIHGSALKDLTVNLSNAYADYLRQPEKLDEILDRMVRQTIHSSQPASQAIARENLVPLIKSREWLEAIKQTATDANATGPDSLPYYDNLNDQLLVTYAEYDGEKMRFVRKGELAEAGIDIAGLRRLACENLVRKCSDTKAVAQANIYLFGAGGTFDVSFILVDPLWDRRQFAVDGDYVIAIPSRGTLAITGSKNVEQVKALQAMASKDYATDPYAISPNLFIRKNGGWTVYNP